jgi:hypothetical protein
MKLSSRPRPLAIAFDVMVIGDYRGDRLKHFEAAQASSHQPHSSAQRAPWPRHSGAQQH